VLNTPSIIDSAIANIGLWRREGLYFPCLLGYREMEYQPMSIELKPETERLVQEEIQSGHFRSVDELIVQGVQALREKASTQPSSVAGNGSAAEAVARLRTLRKGVTLGGLKIKDLAHEGHRF
jgi:Arc/MetJ-type ribon-helix-helix transcriptional regulator